MSQYIKDNGEWKKIGGVEKYPADFGTRAEFEAKKDDLPVGTVFTTTDEFEEETQETMTINGDSGYIKITPVGKNMAITFMSYTLSSKSIDAWGGYTIPDKLPFKPKYQQQFLVRREGNTLQFLEIIIETNGSFNIRNGTSGSVPINDITGSGFIIAEDY